MMPTEGQARKVVIQGRRLWPEHVVLDIVPCEASKGGWEFRNRPQTVLEGLAHQASQRGQKTALQDGDRSFTFADVEAVSSALAASLHRTYGIRKGDRVALLMANSWELAATVLAVFKLGAIAVTLNTKLKSREFSFMLRDCDSPLLIVDPEWWPTVEPIRGGLPTQHYVGAQPVPGQPFPTLGQLIESGHGLPRVEARVSEWDPALIIYTSGTTGLPKGAVLSHRNLVHSTLSDLATLGVTARDRTVIAAPMFHVTGLIAQFLLLLYCGGTSIIMPRFDAGALLHILRTERITFFHAAPTVYTLLLTVPGCERVSLPDWRLAVAGGSATSPDTLKRMRRWQPQLAFCPRYGLTEATSPVSQTPPGALAGHETAGGLPIPIVECQVVDATGSPLPQGEAGELWVRGPNVIKEYWRNAEASEQSLAGAWLRTGDVARFDDAGYLYVLDRIKDMINRGGEKIYSLEVERVLLEHPAVLQAAVIPAPDPIYGEVPKALLVKRPGEALSTEEILAWVAARLAGFKVPASVDFVDALPLNPGGKVLKAALRGAVSSVEKLPDA